jgi:hypothetical protein
VASQRRFRPGGVPVAPDCVWGLLFREKAGYLVMDERDKRIAANEAVFRVLNAEIADLQGAQESRSIVCECGDLACVETFEMSAGEYRRLRADPTTFGVKPGHANAEIEEVIARGRGYDTVRKKTGAAAAVLIREDPGPCE